MRKTREAFQATEGCQVVREWIVGKPEVIQLGNLTVTASASVGRNPIGREFCVWVGDVDRYAHFSETFEDNAAVSDVLAALPQKERSG